MHDNAVVSKLKIRFAHRQMKQVNHSKEVERRLQNIYRVALVAPYIRVTQKIKESIYVIFLVRAQNNDVHTFHKVSLCTIMQQEA